MYFEANFTETSNFIQNSIKRTAFIAIFGSIPLSGHSLALQNFHQQLW
jgi:hypothetical protein